MKNEDPLVTRPHLTLVVSPQLVEVHIASPVVAAVRAAPQSIAEPSNSSVNQTCYWCGQGDAKPIPEPPEPVQSSGNFSQSVYAAITPPFPADQVHFFHQHIVSEVGVANSDELVLQGHKRQYLLLVPLGQLGYLAVAKPAVAVVDNDVALGKLLGVRQSLSWHHPPSAEASKSRG